MAERTLAELAEELAATQYWLRMLYTRFVEVSGLDPVSEADEVRETVVNLKNHPPPAGVNPELYDQAGLARLPHIERIGSDIVEWLEALAYGSDV